MRKIALARRKIQELYEQKKSINGFYVKTAYPTDSQSIDSTVTHLIDFDEFFIKLHQNELTVRNDAALYITPIVTKFDDVPRDTRADWAFQTIESMIDVFFEGQRENIVVTRVEHSKD